MHTPLPRPRIMGILNVTPDSFSDGGHYFKRDTAVCRVAQMLDEGADIIDVGGESTRPGAAAVTVEEELARVVPLIEALRSRFDVPISIDTSKPAVMRAAVTAGATLINDVRALREPGAIETAAALNVSVCLMHMQGEPRSMQLDPHYDDVVTEVKAFLAERVRACEAAGIGRDRLIIDPGFGFGKRLEHNFSLLRQLPTLKTLGLPLLVGVSRKSMIGAVVDRPVEQRLHGSVAAATLAMWLGADVVRVHDVAATVDAMRICQAVKEAR